MIRTKTKTPKIQGQPSGLMGGHMPDPPVDCISPKIGRHPKDNRLYVDSLFCQKCKNGKTCQRLQEFAQEWKEYRKQVRDGYTTTT